MRFYILKKATAVVVAFLLCLASGAWAAWAEPGFAASGLGCGLRAEPSAGAAAEVRAAAAVALDTAAWGRGAAGATLAASSSDTSKATSELSSKPRFKPKRASFTKETSTLSPKILSLESGFRFDFPSVKIDNASFNNYYNIRLSPLKPWELSISVSYTLPIAPNALGAEIECWNLGSKLNVLESKNGGRPGIALYAAFSLPLNKIEDYSIVRRYPIPILAAYVDHIWDSWLLAYNIGIEDKNKLFYSLCLDYNFPKYVTIFLEVVGSSLFTSSYSRLNSRDIEFNTYKKENSTCLYSQIGFSIFALSKLKFDFSLGCSFLRYDFSRQISTPTGLISTIKYQNLSLAPHNLFFECAFVYGINLKCKK